MARHLLLPKCGRQLHTYLSGTQRSTIDKLCIGGEVEDQQDDLQQGLLPVNCQAYRVVSHERSAAEKGKTLERG